jgi:hypothetical protein
LNVRSKAKHDHRESGIGSMDVRGKFRVAAVAASRLPVPVVLALMIGASPAPAAVEQCRFIQAKADREACYQRQEMALAAKRKPEPAADTRTMESVQQMRRDDDAVYQSLRSICRGC